MGVEIPTTGREHLVGGMVRCSGTYRENAALGDAACTQITFSNLVMTQARHFRFSAHLYYAER